MINKDEGLQNCLKMIGNTVCLVTASHGTMRGVTTIAWVSRISNTPPLIMVSVAPERYIHKIITNSKEFNVAVLGNELEELALYCGTKSSSEVDKFMNMKIDIFDGSVISAPLIKDALINLECRLIDSKDVGDHTMFIGEVVNNHRTNEGRPLMVCDRLCSLNY